MKKKSKKELTYEKEYELMEKIYINDGINLDLYNVLIKIIKNNDKNFIFNFIRLKKVQEIIKSIKNSFRFNREEVENIIILKIVEFFNKIELDFNNFNENDFLDEFNKQIINMTRKEVRHCYSAKDIPLSGSNFLENHINDFSEEDIINKIDYDCSIKNFSTLEKNILKLYFIDNYTQREIAELMSVDKMKINRILINGKNNLKNIF